MKLTQNLETKTFLDWCFFASFTPSYISQSQQELENSAINVFAKNKNKKKTCKRYGVSQKFHSPNILIRGLKVGFVVGNLRLRTNSANCNKKKLQN